MIIDRKRKIVYIHAPQTGSTVVGKRLVADLGAQFVGLKHDFLWDLPDDVKSDLHSYYVMTAVREPLSQVLSAYAKGEQRRSGETFVEFLSRTQRGAYLDWRILEHDRCDRILRLDSLEQDFIDAMHDLGVQTEPTLERRNVTENRAEHLIDAKWETYVFGPHRQYLNARAGTTYEVDWSLLSRRQLFWTHVDYRMRVALFRALYRLGMPPTSRTPRWIDRAVRAVLLPGHWVNCWTSRVERETINRSNIS